MPWKLNVDFKAAEKKLIQGARDASRDVADEVKRRAQASAPVQTGRLRDSARVVETEDGAEVQFTAPYAQQINDGHMSETGHFIAPKPFLSNAMEGSRELLDQACAQVAQNVIDDK